MNHVICMLSGLIFWYWIISWCFLPKEGLFLIQLLNSHQTFVMCAIKKYVASLLGLSVLQKPWVIFLIQFWFSYIDSTVFPTLINTSFSWPKLCMPSGWSVLRLHDFWHSNFILNHLLMEFSFILKMALKCIIGL